MSNKQLTDFQHDVLFNEATERPQSSPLNHEWRAGTYHCAYCDALLFKGEHKFDAGCGWPSFDRAEPGAFNTKTDTSHGMVRTEYHCAKCGGHHGHIFPDGPTETGTRYCSNGVVLVFKPAEE